MDEIARLIHEMHDDHLSGAAELARRARHVLSRSLETADNADLADLREQMSNSARALVDAQPSMAPMVNLANMILWAFEVPCSQSETRAAIQAALDAGDRDAQRALTSMTQALRGLIGARDEAVILTHSRSSVVFNVLLAAHRKGKRLSIICTESRPLYEGRALAQALAQVGIPVTIIVDTGAMSATEDSDLVLVGADSIGSGGLINKIGTLGLALAAKAAGKPLYACCSTDKLLPDGYEHRVRILEQDPQEVWDSPPRGVRVANRYFDVTPLEHISGAITECGLLTADEIRRMIRQRKAHPALRDTIE